MSFEPHSQPFLSLVVLWIVSHVIAWGSLDYDLTAHSSHIAGIIDVKHNASLFVEMASW
jgi:hypothetical protein